MHKHLTWRQQIAELKDYFEDEPEPFDIQDDDCPDLLLGRFQQANKQDILAAMPPRAHVDRLIAAYFGAVNAGPGTS